MDQASYWMWMRRKLSDEKSHVQASSRNYNDSWEEQAFAEDSSGPLGGCIWPPRSYSCSFCRREFRSAQALGGHMNVHRRDRARLKQSPNEHHNLSTSLGVHHQVCTLANYSPNPSVVAASSPLSASRVSLPSTLDKCSEQTLVISPCYSSTMVQEHQKAGSLFSSPSTTLSDSMAIKVVSLSDSKLESEKNYCRAQDIGFGVWGEYPKPDSDVNLNLVAFRTRPTQSAGDGDNEGISSKRRKIDTTSLPFFIKPNSVDRHHIQSEVLIGLSPSSMEEIDLELRLGDRPKVK